MGKRSHDLRTSPNFVLTEETAREEKALQWEIVESIAADAVEHDLPITGTTAIMGAQRAFADAGCQYAASTVKDLCAVAKFDHESTPEQRQVWRGYGWSCIAPVAKSSWSHERAVNLLRGPRRLRRADIVRAVRAGAGTTEDPQMSIDQAWKKWADLQMAADMFGSRLQERTAVEAAENGLELAGHAAAFRILYERLTERARTHHRTTTRQGAAPTSRRGELSHATAVAYPLQKRERPGPKTRTPHPRPPFGPPARRRDGSYPQHRPAATTTGSNGTAAFWSHYEIKNGYRPDPSETTASDPYIDIRLTECEDRVEVAAEWLVDLMGRVADLEARVAS